MLSWSVWQVQGEFNYELFRSVSSMFSGKGLPKKAEVQAALSWPVWQVNGQFNHNLFRSFSSMFHGKGLPKECEVAACMGWLSQGDSVDKETLQLMGRLFCGTFAGHIALGLPPVESLRDYEQRTAQLFHATAYDNDKHMTAIKTKHTPVSYTHLTLPTNREV